MNRFILLFSLIIFQVLSDPQKPTERKERLAFSQNVSNNLFDKRTKEINKLNEVLEIYLGSKNWTEKKELDDYTFIRLFIYVTSKSLFRRSTREQLNALAEKIMSLHEGPIIVENLKNYLDYDELRKVYQDLFGKKNLDL